MFTVKEDKTRTQNSGQYFVELTRNRGLDVVNCDRLGYWCDKAHLQHFLLEIAKVMTDDELKVLLGDRLKNRTAIKQKNRFDIKQQVYHNSPDGPAGVVIDCRYSQRANEWEYLVSFGAGVETLWYYEEELSEHKVF